MDPKPSRRFWSGPIPWLIAAVLLACAAIWRVSQAPARIEDPRAIGGAEAVLALKERSDLNVLFVLIDTLRADHLHTYGYRRPTSPIFDLLASQGARFANHTAQSSWTKCSMASLWTGLNPARTGVTRFDHVLPDEARLPAEIFRDAGFRTAGIWRNGWVEGYFGFDQGFDVYTRPPSFGAPNADVRRKNPTVSFGGTDMDTVRMATEFLRVNSRARWFLYLHLMDVHEYSYDQKSARFGSGYADIYDNAILHVNHVIDALLSHLLEIGQLDDTLLVIASDHGEAFGERGSEGHARNVYPEVTRVPFLLSFPFRLERGAVVSQHTANVDVWPTVLDLVGLQPLEGADGRSRVPELLAAIRGSAEPEVDGTLSIAHLDQSWGQRVETPSPTVSMRDGRFRYVQFRNAKGEIRSEELFDTDRDALERDNRLKAEGEVAGAMRARVDEYLAQQAAWKSNVRPLEIDEMQLNQLRALGYAVPAK
jgi:arylsulfatase A-like enzyme